MSLIFSQDFLTDEVSNIPFYSDLGGIVSLAQGVHMRKYIHLAGPRYAISPLFTTLEVLQLKPLNTTGIQRKRASFMFTETSCCDIARNNAYQIHTYPNH